MIKFWDVLSALFFLVFIANLVTNLSFGTEFSSCTQVSVYLNGIDTSKCNCYKRVLTLERAVGFVTNVENGCSKDFIRRTLFAYSQAVEQYSESFKADTVSWKNWRLSAADKYEEYIKWGCCTH